MADQKTSVQITAEVDGIDKINAFGKAIQGVGDISIEAAREEDRLAAIVEASKKRQQMAAQELLAAERKAALESQQLANLTAAAKREATQVQITEEDRLAAIVEAGKKRQQMAAQELLAAEKKAYAEAEAAAKRSAAARESEAKAIEDFSARSKKALADAFTSTGVRSTAAIEADILEVNQALLKLAANAKVSGADFDRAFVAGQARIATLRAEMDGTGAASARLESSTKRLAGEFSGLVTQLGGVYLAFQAGGMFVTANSQAETFARTMTLLSGNSQKAAAEMEYVRSAANRLGLEVQEAAKSYTQLVAATKGTAMEGEGARKVFEAVAGAMASLGKSSAETNNALMAVNQMASKGTVQMEELKGQLGEALPGAMKAAANGAGLTVAELTKMVETGGVLAEDLLPALAKGLNEMYKTGTTNNDTFVANWARLKNAVTETMTVIGDSAVFKVLTLTIGGAAQALGIFTIGMDAAAKKIGVMAAAIANGDFGLRGFSDRAKQALGEIDAKTVESLAKIRQSTTDASAGMSAAGQSAEESGKKAAGASVNWLLIENAYTQVTEASKKQIENLKTLQAARDSEAAAMKAYADIYGTATEKLDAATNAALEHEKASRALAEQVNADLEISKARLASLEAQVRVDGTLTEAKEKLREELQKTIVAKAAEADKTLQATSAAHSATLQAEASAAVYADHAKQIYALRDAYQAAEVEYQRLAALNATGVNVAKELKAADEARAKALLLYRDALSDATAAAERHAMAERAAAGLQQSALQNDLYRANTILEIAKQRGNEKEIAQAQIGVWRIELEISEAQAQAARLEVEAMLLVAKAKRAELEASGALTEAKKAELAVMDANIKAKQLEAEKYDLVAARMKSLAYETKELKSSFGELSSSADDAAAAADRAAGSYDGLRTSIAGAASARNQWATDSSGNIRSEMILTKEWAAQQLESMGVDKERAARVARGYFDEYGNSQNLGGKTIGDVLRREADSLTGKGTMVAASPSFQTVKVVQVDLRTSSGTQSISVVGEDSADAFVRALQDGASARS